MAKQLNRAEKSSVVLPDIVHKTEFDKFMADVVKDYKFIKNADEIYVRGVTEKSVKEAYKIYSNLGL